MVRARSWAIAALGGALAACASLHGRLDWRRADGTVDPVELRDDVYACEEYTAANDDREFRAENARAWGGWGNSTFEWCMHSRAWVLTQVDANAG
jgi:hypothetical protein